MYYIFIIIAQCMCIINIVIKIIIKTRRMLLLMDQHKSKYMYNKTDVLYSISLNTKPWLISINLNLYFTY